MSSAARWVYQQPRCPWQVGPSAPWPTEPVSDRPVSVTPTVQLSPGTMSAPSPSSPVSPQTTRTGVSPSNNGGLLFVNQERQYMGPERTVDMASIPQPTIKVCTGYNNIENRAVRYFYIV